MKKRRPKKPPAPAISPSFKYGTIYRSWAILFLGTLLLGGAVMIRSEERIVYQQTHNISPLQDAVAPVVIFTPPLTIKARQNLQIIAQAEVRNSWAWVGGDFIHEATGVVHEFDLPIEYYYGIEEGESWSEGDTANELWLSAIPAGQYVLRLEFEAEARDRPLSFAIIVKQDVPNLEYWGWALLGITILPALLFLSEMEWNA